MESDKPKCVLVASGEKICIHCKESKPTVEFRESNRKKDGRDSACKPCRKRVENRRAETAKEERSLITKIRCRACNENKPAQDYYVSKNSKTGRTSKCKQCFKPYHQKAYQSNREALLLGNKEWRKRSPEKTKAQSKRDREKRKKSLQWQIERRILRKVDKYAKHGISRDMRSDTESAIGYTFQQLREDIESKFTDGMSWDLVLQGKIEIDHVIPRCSFVYETTDDQDFKDCWSLNNLRPLWKDANRSKSDKMPDGTRGKDVRDKKLSLLAEEDSVAGWGPPPKMRHQEEVCA